MQTRDRLFSVFYRRPPFFHRFPSSWKSCSSFTHLLFLFTSVFCSSDPCLFYDLLVSSVRIASFNLVENFVQSEELNVYFWRRASSIFPPNIVLLRLQLLYADVQVLKCLHTLNPVGIQSWPACITAEWSCDRVTYRWSFKEMSLVNTLTWSLLFKHAHCAKAACVLL